MNMALSKAVPEASGAPLVMLFTTGLASMAMEVVWVRLFTPYVGTVVYAFASILAIYLAATFVGAWFYRKGLHVSVDTLWVAAAVTALLPLVTGDPRLRGAVFTGGVRVAFGLRVFPIARSPCGPYAQRPPRASPSRALGPIARRRHLREHDHDRRPIVSTSTRLASSRTS